MISEEEVKKELQKVQHVGPKMAEKLLEAGITRIADLAVKRPEELKALLGINLKQAKEMVNSALELSWETIAKPKCLSEYTEWFDKNVQRIPTGCSRLDAALRGGVPTNAITTFAGEYGAGKTEFCLQIAVNCKKKYGRGTFWIETEPGTFSPKRLEEMCRAQNVKFESNEFYIVPAREIGDSPHFLFLSYLKAEKILEDNASSGNCKYGVLVIDSFTSKFRGYYTGREMFPDRAREENRHIAKLNQLAAKYNLAVLLTAQVLEIPVIEGQYAQMAKTDHVKKMWGGTVLEHGSTYLFYLRKQSKQDWSITVVDAPDVPFETFQFRITEVGIRD
jgi:DNA repair protein RadA